MAKPKDVLRCSFCGKAQHDIKKLIAGPTVYICNECIDICNEIVADGAPEPESEGTSPAQETSAAAATAPDYLERARDELEAARLLLEHRHYRLCVEIARAAARSALRAFLYVHGRQYLELGFIQLVEDALRYDKDLRRLDDLKLTVLITEYQFSRDADEIDARYGLETATRLVAHVARTLDAA